MKNNLLKKVLKSTAAKLIAAFLMLSSGQSKAASYLYQDDFSANNGALNGRATASGFGNWTNADGAFQVGSDKITINSNTPVDYHTASFSLPTLGAYDILSLSITVRPSGSLFTGIGFNPNPAAYLTQSGYAWVYYEGLGAANPNIQIFQGPSTAGAVYAAPLTHPTLNFDPSLATTFEFTYSASAKTLSLLASNGSNSSTLLNQLNVSTMPQEAFSNFSLQFQGQTLDTDFYPAYVDQLSVSIIPEPTTLDLILLPIKACFYIACQNESVQSRYHRKEYLRSWIKL
jgi:hypothetical protein